MIYTKEDMGYTEDVWTNYMKTQRTDNHIEAKEKVLEQIHPS